MAKSEAEVTLSVCQTGASRLRRSGAYCRSSRAVRLAIDTGMKAADVAAQYRVSGSWVRLWKQRQSETGEIALKGGQVNIHNRGVNQIGSQSSRTRADVT